jgi:hypothetical protein
MAFEPIPVGTMQIIRGETRARPIAEAGGTGQVVIELVLYVHPLDGSGETGRLRPLYLSTTAARSMAAQLLAEADTVDGATAGAGQPRQ